MNDSTSDWNAFLMHWNRPELRLVIAESIPDLVASIWTDRFLKISHGPIYPQDWQRTRDEERVAYAAQQLLHNIISRTKTTSTTLLLSLFFIHRYRGHPKSQIGCPGSEFRMFLVGILLAQKYIEDHPYSNRVWAHIASIPTAHLNAMEREFLKRIEHQLCVELTDFQSWVVALDRRFNWTRVSVSAPHMRADYRSLPLPPTPNIINRKEGRHSEQHVEPIIAPRRYSNQMFPL